MFIQGRARVKNYVSAFMMFHTKKVILAHRDRRKYILAATSEIMPRHYVMPKLLGIKLIS